jgi:hypothetical protein
MRTMRGPKQTQEGASHKKQKCGDLLPASLLFIATAKRYRHRFSQTNGNTSNRAQKATWALKCKRPRTLISGAHVEPKAR